ncbi:MAG: FAD-dependent monooxygenase [Chloroflexi bacterium]|nr:FAD-dependent monooxygenase [Chloroflexota bacterium]MBV9597985.1 FAD-dependent monooxygenase [Chloroflexota bacterium]
MSKIIVLGGGMIGLSTAMLLARQGHDVSVFESDPTPPPESPEAAWQAWERKGVAQFRQPHYLHSGGREIVDNHLPELKEALVAAGCVPFNTLNLMPRSIADREARTGDERFATITGRRTTLEYAAAKAAANVARVERGVTVDALLTGDSVADGIPHVTGVRTRDGAEVHADLVIDATGRRSKLSDWLVGVGARPPIEECEESGFFYYTRFFQSHTGDVPAFRAGLLTNFPSFSLLTLPGDANTWSVTVFFFTGDPLLKLLRDAVRWTSLISACPTHAQWLEGEPITDVLPMGGITDRYRRFVVDGAPVATGVLAVGDAWGCTNPVGGRGMTMGLMNAVGTAEVVREHLDSPLDLAFAHDNMTETKMVPWYRSTVEMDRIRTAQITAAIQGQPAQPAKGPGDALAVAMLYDASLFRAYLEITSLLALPREVFSRPGIVDRIMELADIHPPAEPPCPTREELVTMLR